MDSGDDEDVTPESSEIDDAFLATIWYTVLCWDFLQVPILCSVEVIIRIKVWGPPADRTANNTYKHNTFTMSLHSK